MKFKDTNEIKNTAKQIVAHTQNNSNKTQECFEVAEELLTNLVKSIIKHR